ncbi:Ribosome maturation factor RimM [Halioglobus japonicus]|nr:Ribosome maturation factor RimM [Halioglobus japonicus]
MSEAHGTGLLVVGKITGCFGIKGWVKIHPYTEMPESFEKFGAWQLKRRGVYEAVEFDAVNRQGKGLVAHIRGVDDRTLAEQYRGLEIAVSADALPPLPEGDYYWRDLQGLAVWCQDAEHSGEEKVLLGNVDYLIETGANDVLVVKACEGSIDERERLIPYLPGDTVVRVDLEEALIEVDWFVDEE